MSIDYKHVVIFGDMHLPWSDKEAVRLSINYVRQNKPDLICQIGDIFDNFNYSRFYRSPDVISPRIEMLQARKQGLEFWKQVRAASPKARCIQILGNHDAVRLEKMALTLTPSLAHLVKEKIMELLTFPGVETLSSEKHHFSAMVQGEKVTFLHGCFSNTLQHAKHFMTNVVLGHLHRAEIIPYKQGDKDLFAMNVGYLGNENSPVFNYTQLLNKAWTVGLGVIDKDGPRFISKRALRRNYSK